MQEALDKYERILEQGLLKVCAGSGLGGRDWSRRPEVLESPDFDAVWDAYIKEYIADAVENFNEYPQVAIAWAGFLGMGVAHNWDAGWEAHSGAPYSSYYGPKGFDDLDENVLYNVLRLDADTARKYTELMLSLSEASLGLISHENIETATAFGFHVLARTYTVLFRLGCTMELERLGYKKSLLR